MNKCKTNSLFDFICKKNSKCYKPNIFIKDNTIILIIIIYLLYKKY